MTEIWRRLKDFQGALTKYKHLRKIKDHRLVQLEGYSKLQSSESFIVLKGDGIRPLFDYLSGLNLVSYYLEYLRFVPEIADAQYFLRRGQLRWTGELDKLSLNSAGTLVIGVHDELCLEEDLRLRKTVWPGRKIVGFDDAFLGEANDYDIHPSRREEIYVRQRRLREVLFDEDHGLIARKDALECLFQCVQNAGFLDRRRYASPADVDVGSFVALDRDSNRIHELSPRSGRRESVNLNNRFCCKILCSACYGKNEGFDLGDYAVSALSSRILLPRRCQKCHECSHELTGMISLDSSMCGRDAMRHFVSYGQDVACEHSIAVEDVSLVNAIVQFVKIDVMSLSDHDLYLHIRPVDENGILPEHAASISFFAEPQSDKDFSLVSDISIRSDDDGEEWQVYESTLDSLQASFEQHNAYHFFKPGPCQMAVVKAIEDKYPRKAVEGRYLNDDDYRKLESSGSVNAAESDGRSVASLTEQCKASSGLRTESVTDWSGLYVDENEESVLPQAGRASADLEDSQQPGGAQEKMEAGLLEHENGEGTGEANVNADLTLSGDEDTGELPSPEGGARGTIALTHAVGNENDPSARAEPIVAARQSMCISALSRAVFALVSLIWIWICSSFHVRPSLRLSAIRSVEADDELSASEKVRFIKISQRDVGLTEAYLTLSSPALRTAFVKEELHSS